MIYAKELLIFLTCLSWSYCKLDKYCSVCENHTMCKYQGIGENCEDVGEFGVSSEEKKEILALHNWYRRLIATGHETRGSGGPQPKAADMMKFTWDEDLATVAQRWADQCHFMHDECRNDPRWIVGQNIFWKWKFPTHHVNWTEAISSWYGEVSLYNPEEVSAYRFEPATGHYTQLLWHDTYNIGCGRRDYGANKLYVCNYGPAGNWVGEPLYAAGEPCSKCPKGTFCDEYLCTFNTSNEVITLKPDEKIFETNVITQAPIKIQSSTTKRPNESKKNETQKPSKENSQDVHGASLNKTKTQKTSNHTIQTQIKFIQGGDLLQLLLRGKEEELKSTTNTIEENNNEIDSEIKSGIEDIKIRIEKLMRKLITKIKSQC